ncbi:MAG: membrane protein insertase YidC [Flavobacteriales bacterium]|nr:membrane protein insertase YidC [Flavobacteriales bacterium]
MDKNSAIGLTLILLIFLGFNWYNMPSEEERAEAKRVHDSIATVEEHNARLNETAIEEAVSADSTTVVESATPETLAKDSVALAEYKGKFGEFGDASMGEDGTVVIENDLLAITVNKKGGHPLSVQLKKYQTYDSLPLLLFDGQENRFSLDFFAKNNRVSTQELYFEPSTQGFTVSGEEKKSLSMRLKAGPEQYIEYVYTLTGGSYLVDFDINFVGMQNVIERNATTLDLHWKNDLPHQEKSLQNERDNSTIYYRFSDDEVDYISERSDEKEEIKTDLQWVAFKQQFFSSVLINKDGWQGQSDLETMRDEASTSVVKTFDAKLTVPYGHREIENVALQFYYGPNQYNSLKDLELGLEHMVPLGWGIFGWVNQFAVIPIFNLLKDTGLGYGIIILILTLVIKLVLMPFTYKAYMSTAKMRVLKPEIDEINKKFEGKDDPMAKQQATMALYSKAGVNPLGGCLPMLFQMPILIALFRFFPASIELRQQSFLWADDLSSYDSIYDLPFEIPFYGDHISLFTLLMTISTIIYTRSNMNMQAGNPQMEQMKWMMYLMPVMMLGWFNNYASGLSYYYFLANMVTFGQNFIFTKLVDDDAIHAKLQENKKNPKKPSGFQKRLEEMAKQRGYQPPKSDKKK